MTKSHVRHLMVYVKWDVIDKWKKQEKDFKQYQRDKVAKRAPYAYGSAQCCLYTLAEPGTVIWVVSAPNFNGRLLPPTIIARLCVRKRINRKDSSYDSNEIPGYFSKNWHYVVFAEGPPESFYLPLNNAFREITTKPIFKGQKEALKKCKHCDKLRKETGNLYSGLPSHLQTIRELIPARGEELTNWVSNIQQGKNVFLSYRHEEARPLAEYLAEKLIDQRMGCWWDEWNLPLETLKGDKLTQPDPKLEADLVDGLRQSTFMVALVTQTYHDEKYWAVREWEKALEEQEDKDKRRTRKLQVIEVLLSGNRSGEEKVKLIDARNLNNQEIARKILNTISDRE